MRIHRLVTAFATLAALASVTPVSAQEVHLRAHVPFAFTAGSANFPVDTYRLARMHDHPEMVFLRGDRTGTFLRTDEVRLPRDADGTPSLVFHRFGDQYFLREIRWEGTTRLDLPETRAERVAAEGHRNRTAARMDTVVITAERR
jgi:hypothetical protein